MVLFLSNKNDDNAKKMLLIQFGCKDLTINVNMNKLLNLTPVKRAWNIAAICRLYDDIGIQVRSLRSMGVVSDTYGTYSAQSS